MYLGGFGTGACSLMESSGRRGARCNSDWACSRQSGRFSSATMDAGPSSTALRSATVSSMTTPAWVCSARALKVASFMPFRLSQSLPAQRAHPGAGPAPVGGSGSSFDEAGHRCAGDEEPLENVRVEFDADRVVVELSAAQPVQQVLVGGEVVHLQFDAVAVGVFVVQGGGRAVVDAPHRIDTRVGQTTVGVDQVLEAIVAERDVVDAEELAVDLPHGRGDPEQSGHPDQCDAVMLLVVSQEGDPLVLEHHH